VHHGIGEGTEGGQFSVITGPLNWSNLDYQNQVGFCGVMNAILRNLTFLFVEQPLILQTIKGLLWQATLR
jgi:hypothetical protein